jgi:LPS export ABC transporter protein LptC
VRTGLGWRSAAVVAGLAAAACHDAKTPPVAAKTALADSSDQVMFKSVANLTDRGVLKGQMRADTAFFYDDNTRLVGHTVQVTFFTETGARNGVLTGRLGTYNEQTGNMDARGNVVVISEDGRRLTTPYLVYTQSANQISSDSAFTLTDTTARRLDGIGFDSDPNMVHLRCRRACSGAAGIVNFEAPPPGAMRPLPATGRRSATPGGPPVPPPAQRR